MISQQLIKTIPAHSLNCMSESIDKLSELLKQPIAIEYTDALLKSRTAVVLFPVNDYSDLNVLIRLLNSCFKPAFNTSLIVARAESFTEIMVPQKMAAKRCENSQSRHHPNGIFEYICSTRPEFVLNIQGSQYSGPPFALANHCTPKHTALCSYFTQWLIHVDNVKGAPMEMSFTCPTLTVEAHGCEDEKYDDTIYRGLKRLLTCTAPFVQRQSVDILHNPIRLLLAPHVNVAFSDRPVFGTDISLNADIDALNFGDIDETSLLGWTNFDDLSCFTLQDGNATATIDEYFIIKNGEIRPQAGLKIFMATPRLDIARDDCLLYFIDLNKQLTHIPQGIAEQDTNLATVR